MKFIFLILFISYPAFAYMGPHVGPHVGMDPICMIAIQAGMSGRSASQSVSLEDQIAEIEARLEELEEEIKGDRKALLDANVFKTFRCYQAEDNDNTSTRCAKRRGHPATNSRSQKRIKDRSIIESVKTHVKGNKNAPEKCADVASEGEEGVVFYFEQFLPHLQYAGFPLKIISPSSAVAAPAIDAADRETATSVEPATVPALPATSPPTPPEPNPEREPASTTTDGGDPDAAETCECPDGSVVGPSGRVCIINDFSRCPVTGPSSSWQKGPMGDTAEVCYADCGVGAIEWPEEPVAPEPAPASCNPVCQGNQQCEEGSCVCTDENKEVIEGSCEDKCSDPTPKRQGNRCVCEDNSCGDRTCNNVSGQCEEVVSAPAEPDTPFDWCKNCDCRYKKYFEDEGDIDIDGLCEDPVLLTTDVNGEIEELARDDCRDYLQYIVENGKEMNALIEERDGLKRQKEREDRENRRLARRCERNPNLEICRQRHPGMTEAGTFCTSCFQEVIDAAYPKKSGWDKLFETVVPLAGAGMAYYGAKETNKLRARQGFPVDNSAMYGLAYPFITKMLYGGALSGRGRNALACSPTAHQNPYSGIFHGHAHAHGSGSFFPGMPGYPGAGIPGSGFNLFAQQGAGFAQHLYPGIPGAYPGMPGAYPGAAFNLQAGLGPGAGLYPGAYPGAGFNLQTGLGPGAGLYPGAYPGAGFNLQAGLGPGAGLYPGAPGAGLHGGFNQQYQAQLQMQQQMQSYYLQLQQFQMEKQRRRQSVMLRYQQEVQSLSLKYQTYLSNVSPGGSPGIYPGASPGTYPAAYPGPGGNPAGGGSNNPYE